MIYKTRDAAFAAWLCMNGLRIAAIRRDATRPTKGDNPEFFYFFSQNDLVLFDKIEEWRKSTEHEYHETVMSLRHATPFERLKRADRGAPEMFLTRDVALASWLKMRNEPVLAIRLAQGGAREFGFAVIEQATALAMQFTNSSCSLFDAKIRTLRKMTALLRDMTLRREKRKCAVT